MSTIQYMSSKIQFPIYIDINIFVMLKTGYRTPMITNNFIY